MVKRTAVIYGLAFVASLATISVAYFPFYWVLVQFETWGLGHPNPFTIGQAIDAMPCSFVAGLVVFWLTVRQAKRRWPQEK